MLYVGVTNDIIRRVSEHKEGLNESFTKKYNIHKLVYFETYQYINQAIEREKQLKGYIRAKKDKLISDINPDWIELKP